MRVKSSDGGFCCLLGGLGYCVKGGNMCLSVSEKEREGEGKERKGKEEKTEV